MREPFTLKVITPETCFYSGDVGLAEFTTSEGQVGIYNGHIPLTATVVPCVLTIHEESQKLQADLLPGFVQILPESVTILTEGAMWK